MLADSLKEVPSVVGVSLVDGPQKTLTQKAGFWPAPPTRIYRLSGLLGAGEANLKALGAAYARFLEAYRGQHWDAAELLRECRELGVTELNEVYSIFADRIEEFRRRPQMIDWDGSFTMEEK